jgi:hypothetical protein
MVNFYLNIDASGSATATPNIPTFEYIDSVVIENDTTIKITLTEAVAYERSQYENNLTVSITTTESTENLSSPSYDATHKILTFTSSSDTFIYQEVVNSLEFNITGLDNEEEHGQLNYLNLPFGNIDSSKFTQSNLITQPVIPGTQLDERKVSIKKITIKNRSQIEIEYNNPDLLTTADPYDDSYKNSSQIIKLKGVTLTEMSSSAFTGSTLVGKRTYTFKPIFLQTHIYSDISVETTGTKYIISGTYDENQINANAQVGDINYVFTSANGDITSAKFTNELESETSEPDPANANVLGYVQVPATVFANIFKFKLTTALPNGFTSSKNTFNIPSDMEFKYDFTNVDDASFNDLQDWSWYNATYPTLTSPPYEPWVDDVNQIAKDMFGNNSNNTIYITADIFKNEDALITTVKNGYTVVIDNIESIFDGTSANHTGNSAKNTTSLALNESDNILLNDSSELSGNIPQFLLEQILEEHTSFTRLNDKTNSTAWTSIPLIAGDRLIMNFELKVKYTDPFNNNASTTEHVNSKNTSKLLVIELI